MYFLEKKALMTSINYKDFICACKNGDLKSIDKFLVSAKTETWIYVDILPWYEKSDENNALFVGLKHASEQGNLEVLKKLIFYGFDLNYRYSIYDYFDHPLIIAAEFGYVDIIDFCIEQNVNINMVSRCQYTAASLAARHGKLDVLLRLLNKGVNFSIKENNRALWYACQSGHVEMLDHLIVHGVDLYHVYHTENLNSLMVAILCQKTQVVQKLLDYCYDVNIRDKNGETALFYACKRGSLEIIQMLLDHNADINIINNQGRTALFYAYEKNNLEIIDLLTRQIH